MLWRQRGVEDIELPTDHLELPFFNLGPRVGFWSPPRLGHFTAGKETRYPLYRRLAPRCLTRQARKILPAPGFEPRTAQSVVRGYTEYAILVPFYWGRTSTNP